MRFAVSPFDEPFGQDCYFNILGYDIFGSILLAWVCIAILFHVLSLADKHTKLISFVIILQAVEEVILGCGIVVGFIQPRAYVVVFTLFFFLLLGLGIAWFALGYHAMVVTMRKVDPNRKSTVGSGYMGDTVRCYFELTVCDIFKAEFFGGRLALGVFLSSLTLTGVGSLIGIAGAAAVYFNQVAPDDALGVSFYRLWSASTGTFVLIFYISSWKVMTEFSNFIERTANAASPAVKAGGSEHAMDEIKEIARRLRVGRNFLILGSPIGAGFWFIQAICLPMFWYIALLQTLNMTNASMAVLYSVLSRSRKQRLKQRLCCGRKFSGTVSDNGPVSGPVAVTNASST